LPGLARELDSASSQFSNELFAQARSTAAVIEAPFQVINPGKGAEGEERRVETLIPESKEA
jgi:hypothetical protein